MSLIFAAAVISEAITIMFTRSASSTGIFDNHLFFMFYELID